MNFDYDAQLSEAELSKGSLAAVVDDCEDDDYQLVSSLTNESEYIGEKLSTNTAVPGNIHRLKYRDFWRSLNPSDLVWDTICNGYRLPFISLPPPSMERNNKSARDDMPFVREEVKRLESLGCIQRVQHRPRCVLPLSSVFSKKKRLVVDGSRCLNPYLRHRRVRLQDLRDVPELIKEGYWVYTDDLDSGYWVLNKYFCHRQLKLN